MDILKEAAELTDSILNMTQALVITGQKEQEETEVESYAKLMETREPLINKLTELKKGIDAVMMSSPEFAAIKQTIEKISEIDKVHLSSIKNMVEIVQASHKDVKTGQRIHNAYVGAPSDNGYHRFDTKQ